MLTRNLQIALRNIVRNKAFSFVNLSGLTLGIVAFLIIQVYVSTEQAYDKFHEDYKFIYRIHIDHFENNTLTSSGSKVYPAVGPQLQRTFPEIQSFVRFFSFDHAVCTYEDKKILEQNILVTDNSFTNFFSYKVLSRSGDSLLSKPFSVVLTRQTADKYFGVASPIGKSISMQIDQTSIPLQVTGIIEDQSENSSLKFGFLISYSTLYSFWAKEDINEGWRRAEFVTYVKLDPSASYLKLQDKLKTFMEAHLEKTFLSDVTTNEKDVISLEPLTSIHLNAAPALPFESTGSGQAVKSLSIISYFILLLAWFNYINLTTARALKRAKEVGIRKAIGATRLELLRQFLLECTLLNFAAILIGTILYIIIAPIFFNSLNISTPPLVTSLLDYPFWIRIGVLAIIGSIISGAYPASVISSFNPVASLKGSLSYGGSPALRKLLVAIQFAVSAALTISAFAIFWQIKFMHDKDLGINVEQIMVLNAPTVKESKRNYESNINAFKNEMASNPAIEKISFASTMPGTPLHEFPGLIRRIESDPADVHNFKLCRVDDEYFEIFENRFMEGQNFPKNALSTRNYVIINQSATKLLGFESEKDAINQRIIFPGDSGPEEKQIIGVIKDYNHFSLKTGYDPQIFSIGINDHVGFFAIKFRNNYLTNNNNFLTTNQQSWEKIQRAWSTYFPGNPITKSILKEKLNEQYIQERQLQLLIGIFSGFAIMIAMLGFISLVAFGIVERMKELSIRKVLGATKSTILLLISRAYMFPIIIGCLIALPISGYYLNQWLQNYAFRITLHLFLFVLPVSLLVFFTFLLMAVQTLSVIKSNPVKALRI